MIITIVLWLFIILESLNVMILFFHPTSRKGNGVAVFNTYNDLQDNESTKLFTTYLVNWIGSTKVIFIVLLIIINVFASDLVKILSALVLIPAISLYYFKLHPIIKKLDESGEINPRGYSKTLGIMIAVFIMTFAAAIVVQIIT